MTFYFNFVSKIGNHANELIRDLIVISIWSSHVPNNDDIMQYISRAIKSFSRQLGVEGFPT